MERPCWARNYLWSTHSPSLTPHVEGSEFPPGYQYICFNKTQSHMVQRRFGEQQKWEKSVMIVLVSLTTHLSGIDLRQKRCTTLNPVAAASITSITPKYMSPGISTRQVHEGAGQENITYLSRYTQRANTNLIEKIEPEKRPVVYFSTHSVRNLGMSGWTLEGELLFTQGLQNRLEHLPTLSLIKATRLFHFFTVCMCAQSMMNPYHPILDL